MIIFEYLNEIWSEPFYFKDAKKKEKMIELNFTKSDQKIYFKNDMIGIWMKMIWYQENTVNICFFSYHSFS